MSEQPITATSQSCRGGVELGGGGMQSAAHHLQVAHSPMPRANDHDQDTPPSEKEKYLVLVKEIIDHYNEHGDYQNRLQYSGHHYLSGSDYKKYLSHIRKIRDAFVCARKSIIDSDSFLLEPSKNLIKTCLQDTIRGLLYNQSNIEEFFNLTVEVFQAAIDIVEVYFARGWLISEVCDLIPTLFFSSKEYNCMYTQYDSYSKIIHLPLSGYLEGKRYGSEILFYSESLESRKIHQRKPLNHLLNNLAFGESESEEAIPILSLGEKWRRGVFQTNQFRQILSNFFIYLSRCSIQGESYADIYQSMATITSISAYVKLLKMVDGISFCSNKKYPSEVKISAFPKGYEELNGVYTFSDVKIDSGPNESVSTSHLHRYDSFDNSALASFSRIWGGYYLGPAPVYKLKNLSNNQTNILLRLRTIEATFNDNYYYWNELNYGHESKVVYRWHILTEDPSNSDPNTYFIDYVFLQSDNRDFPNYSSGISANCKTSGEGDGVGDEVLVSGCTSPIIEIFDTQFSSDFAFGDTETPDSPNEEVFRSLTTYLSWLTSLNKDLIQTDKDANLFLNIIEDIKGFATSVESYLDVLKSIISQAFFTESPRVQLISSISWRLTNLLINCIDDKSHPTEINVSNCGSEECNGIYTLVEQANRKASKDVLSPMYEHQSLVTHQTFYLQRYRIDPIFRCLTIDSQNCPHIWTFDSPSTNKTTRNDTTSREFEGNVVNLDDCQSTASGTGKVVKESTRKDNRKYVYYCDSDHCHTNECACVKWENECTFFGDEFCYGKGPSPLIEVKKRHPTATQRSSIEWLISKDVFSKAFDEISVQEGKTSAQLLSICKFLLKADAVSDETIVAVISNCLLDGSENEKCSQRLDFLSELLPLLSSSHFAAVTEYLILQNVFSNRRDQIKSCTDAEVEEKFAMLLKALHNKEQRHNCYSSRLALISRRDLCIELVWFLFVVRGRNVDEEIKIIEYFYIPLKTSSGITEGNVLLQLIERKSGKDLELIGNNAFTAKLFILAIASGNIQVCRLIISKGISINFQNSVANSFLKCSLKHSKYDISLLILGQGLNVFNSLDETNKLFVTLLLESRLNLREKNHIFDLLLEKEYDINNDGSSLFSALAHFLSIGPDECRKNIDLVVSQASCSRKAALRALRKNDYDIVNAIMELTMDDKPQDKFDSYSDIDDEPIFSIKPLIERLFFSGLNPLPMEVSWLTKGCDSTFSTVYHCVNQSYVLALINLFPHKFVALDFDFLYELVNSLLSEALSFWHAHLCWLSSVD